MEEQRDERKGYGGNEGADKDIGHTLADWGSGAVGKTAEYGQKDERGKVVAGHDDAHYPLDVQNFFGVARLQLGGGEVVHTPCEDIRQEGGAPGVVDLPQQKYSEKCEAYKRGALVVELQVLGFVHVIFLRNELSHVHIRASAHSTLRLIYGQRSQYPPR